MYILDTIKKFSKEFFSKKLWWIVFPFSLIAIVLIALYYLFVPIYMLFDLAVRKIDELLCGKYDNTTGSVLLIRNLIAFIFIIPFYAYLVVFNLILAVIYFLAYIAAFIGCGFRRNGKLFAFHEYLEV